MAIGAATSHASSGEAISHFTGVRMRIVGQGEFEMRMISLDEVYDQQMLPFQLEAITNREPLRLVDFTQQRAMFEGKTTTIDAQFKINRIILFSKYMWNEYPE